MSDIPQVAGRIYTQPLPDGFTLVRIMAPQHGELAGELVHAIVRQVKPFSRGTINCAATEISCVVPDAVVSGKTNPEVFVSIKMLLTAARHDRIVLNVSEPSFAQGGSPTGLPAFPEYVGTVQRGGWSVGLPTAPRLGPTHS